MALNETNAQIFSLEGGLGAGSVLETDNTLGKGVLRLGGNYHYTENLHFGITAETGGRLLPFDTEDEIINNQTILNAADFNFEILSLQAKYHFFQFWNTKVYVALSVGGANFYRRINEDRVTERNFIIIPEIGLAIYDVNLALRYYSKGNTPTFSDGSRLLLSEKYSMILLQASYRLRFGKK
ncbi:MAG: hypothetical protein AAFQ94_05395 [Bacteroidota bacterium]